MAKEKLTTEGYVAIRRNRGDGHVWMDMQTFSTVHAGTHKQVADTAGMIPQWHEDNPVLRVVHVLVTEVDG